VAVPLAPVAARRPHVVLGPALDYARALAAALDEDPGSDELQELQLRLIDWIEGRTTGLSQELQRSLHARLPVRARVLALSDFGTLPRVYGYMLSGLGMLARRRGYEGLLLLLDETELFASLDTESRSRAVDVFRVLLSAALPAQGGRALDLTGVRKGGRGIIRRLPPRFGVRSHLAICLAATPGSSSEVFLRQTLGENRVLELSAFGSREYREMGDRILDLYLAAHPGMRRSVIAGLESRMERWLSGGLPSGPREFARRSVDFLDQCRHTSFDFS
ncbi:MAG: BREX system ATP-binding domain-containing protein, partial [Planctomycetota bacterium]